MNNEHNTSPAKKLLSSIASFTRKHKVFTTITAIVIAIIAFFVIGTTSAINSSNAERARQDEEARPKFEQIDVNGIVIEEACEKLRAKGWNVSVVEGTNDGYVTERTDCSDTTHKVEFTSYYDKDVSITFSSDKKHEDDSPADTPSDDSTSSEDKGSNDDKVSQIEKSALAGGICRYIQETKGEIVSVNQAGTGATTEFINLGIKLFKRNTCQEFGYQLSLKVSDSRGNESQSVVLQFNATKEQFGAYNWKNLEGRVVGTQLQNDGIITMVNRSIGLDPNKLELYSLE